MKKEIVKCDYITKGTHFDGERAKYRVSVVYNEFDSDTLHLCKNCADYVAKDAVRYGYKVSVAIIENKGGE
jgi:hypothetical protein